MALADFFGKRTASDADSSKPKLQLILAPMVRISTLPFRLLALEYGADQVYTEETVDFKLLGSQRIRNDVLGTIDYCAPGEDSPVLRTSVHEKDRVVLQIGTNSPERAIAVGKLVQRDVAGIDVNMGCPKAFSIKGGMGSALLTQPDKVKNILSSMVHGLDIPVSCKIRILPKLEDTLELCSLIEKTGVSAIAVHGRTRAERSRHSNHYDVIREIRRSLSIPVIANGASGDIKTMADIMSISKRTECNSLMLARIAEKNCSIFNSDGFLPRDDVIRRYLQLAVDYQCSVQNVKYTIQQMIGDEQQTTARGRALLAAASLGEACELWEIQDYYNLKSAELKDRTCRSLRQKKLIDSLEWEEGVNNEDVIQKHVRYLSKHFKTGVPNPKFILNERCNLRKQPLPSYHMMKSSVDGKYRAILSLDGQRYSSIFWERNKRLAEQGAATVAVIHLGLDDALPSAFLDEGYFETDS